MARYKYRVIIEPKNKKDLDVMFDSLDNILNDPSEYEGKFEYDYLNDKSFYVDFALSMDANVFATSFDPKLVNIISSINESKISTDAINAEVLKPDFYGAVLIYCDNGSKINKLVMYPAGINKFRVCDYDKYNPRMPNARDTKIQAKTLIDALEIVQNILNLQNGEVIKVVPLNRNESIAEIEIKEEIRIPGTDIILEKGDKIYKVFENLTDYKYLEVIYNIPEYKNYIKEFEKFGYNKLDIQKFKKVKEAYLYSVDSSKINNFHPDIIYDLHFKRVMIEMNKYNFMDVDEHLTFIDQMNDANKAAKLLINLLNDDKFWSKIPDKSDFYK